MADLGKAILAVGVLLIVVGGALLLAGRLGAPLGRLPGDFAWRGKSTQVHFPLGTCIVMSIVLTAAFYILSLLRK